MSTILVVDDEASGRGVLRALLGPMGHRVIEAADGASGLTLAQLERPDLVIADILMPVMDGYEFVRRLRADEATRNLPVLFCSAYYHEPEARRLASTCGVSAIITKPVEPEVVLPFIQDFLGLEGEFRSPPAPTDFDREHARLLSDKLSRNVEDLGRTNVRLEAILELMLRLGSETDTRRLMQSLCDATRRIVGARTAVVGVLDESGASHQYLFTSGMDPAQAVRIGSPDPGWGAISRIVNGTKAVRFARDQFGRWDDPVPGDEPGLTSWMGVPIASPSRVYGWIGLADRFGLPEFTEEDEKLALNLGAQAGRIHENGLLVAASRRHADELERQMEERSRLEQRQQILLDVGSTLASARRVSDAFMQTMSVLSDWLDIRSGTLWLADAAGTQLVPSRTWSSGAGRSLMVQRTAEAGSPPSGVVRAWRERAVYAGAAETEDPVPGLEPASVAVPVIRADRVLAVVEFQLVRFEPGEGGVPVLTAVGEQLGQFFDRCMAEEALAESEERLRQITENLNDVTWLSNHDLSEMLYISPSYERVWGRSRRSITENPASWMESVHQDDMAELQVALQRAMAGEAMVYEFRIRRPDGETRRIRARVAPIRTADGRVHRLTGTALDVTEADQLEQQLRQAQKMEAVGTLAGGVAHDFNNLLTIIGGFADLLAVRLQADPRSKEMVAEIRRSVDRAASLTRQLLAFSRKQVLAPVVLDLNRIVAETSRMVQRLIGEDIEFNAVPDPGLGPIRADPGQVEQVLMNLVINARDAMPTGGRLTVETRRVVLDDGETCIRTELRPGEYSVVSVSDTGTGMAPEVQQHIFEPFFTTKAAGRGTGLGLATVYGIVKQSGGGVQVYSEVGIGTTFKVYFPVTTGSVARATTSPVAAPGGKETILLVEDDNTVRALVRTMLEQVGYNVLEAADGFMALDRAKSHGPGIDLLITDVVMPRAGGRHVVDALKAERPDIKVLYLSGYTDDAIVRHGILQGGANFLQKPFTATVLTTRVREILDG